MARKRRKSKSARLRILIEAQDGRCRYCKCILRVDVHQGHPDRATTDHLIPSARGGSNRIDNVVACCFRCNNMKGHLTEEEFLHVFSNNIGHINHLSTIARKLRASGPIIGELNKCPLPDNLKFVDEMEGVLVQMLDNFGQHYRLTLPNGVMYDFWPSTGSWTRIGSFVWTKGYRAAEKLRKEVERMLAIMPTLLRELQL